MKRPLSLTSRLALLFAACTAAVSLGAGLVFNHASEQHFIELDQQLLASRLSLLRRHLADVGTQDDLQARLPALREELTHQADLALRVTSGSGRTWFESRAGLPPAPASAGLTTLHAQGTDYRSLAAALVPGSEASPHLVLYLDITHHQHFLQGMQRLIWLTVGLSALITALLGAWAARSGLRPLRQMGRITARVGAHSLTTRLPVAQMPAELAELGNSLNAMLQRLDDAFERLSAFSADIAHELRTPLSNLLTHTQVTLTRPRSLEAYREALHDNLEELQAMAQMINDMLFLAKADHGLVTRGDTQLALHEEVDALLDYYALVAEDADVQLTREGEAALLGDRTMLRRALCNLLDNALRFTPAGGQVRITLTAGPRITVANTGNAIAATAMPRLFDRFYRIDPARHEGGGEHAGLGLAITRSIVQAHGGQIRVACEAGWTCFTLDFTGR
nr:heavy metal sensor histidine kinase [uncultured Pseudomonas sp.]